MHMNFEEETVMAFNVKVAFNVQTRKRRRLAFSILMNANRYFTGTAALAKKRRASILPNGRAVLSRLR